MRQTRTLAYLCLLICFAILMSANAVAQTFTLGKTVTIDFGAVWCVPVYDGTNIVVSSESGGAINPTFAIRTEKQLFLGTHRPVTLEFKGVNFPNGL